MVELPEPENKTGTLIYSGYTNSAPRSHLGASQIGESCERKLWYSFRHCKYPAFEPRMLRLFESGQIEEERIIRNLRRVGITVWNMDENTGKQFEFKLFWGHFSGSCDGVGLGFPEAPKTPHLIEIKTSNEKSFRALIKKGVKEFKPLHYAQMVIYMDQFRLARAMYICVNKNTDEIYTERVYENKPYAAILKSKATRIIFSEIPLEREGTTVNAFCCKWCEFKDLCWEKKLPEINCRTCAMSTPTTDGTWLCGVNDNQKSPCQKHVYIPNFVARDVIDADNETPWIEYAGGIRNGVGYLSSNDLKEMF